jgi:hypothetical protein
VAVEVEVVVEVAVEVEAEAEEATSPHLCMLEVLLLLPPSLLG